VEVGDKDNAMGCVVLKRGREREVGKTVNKMRWDGKLNETEKTRGYESTSCRLHCEAGASNTNPETKCDWLTAANIGETARLLGKEEK